MSRDDLSRREREIIDLLYENGPLTVAEITENLPDPLSRNAVQTFLTLLIGKQKVTRSKEGRTYRYQPATAKKKAAQEALGKVLDIFFGGSLTDALAARLAGDTKEVSEEELKRLEKLIEEARQKNS